jgi:hypothetical protein
MLQFDVAANLSFCVARVGCAAARRRGRAVGLCHVTPAYKKLVRDGLAKVDCHGKVVRGQGWHGCPGRLTFVCRFHWSVISIFDYLSASIFVFDLVTVIHYDLWRFA